MRKRAKHRMMRQAAKAPSWVRDIAASKSAGRFKRSLGKFGAASAVRVLVKDGKPA